MCEFYMCDLNAKLLALQEKELLFDRKMLSMSSSWYIFCNTCEWQLQLLFGQVTCSDAHITKCNLTNCTIKRLLLRCIPDHFLLMTKSSVTPLIPKTSSEVFWLLWSCSCLIIMLLALELIDQSNDFFFKGSRICPSALASLMTASGAGRQLWQHHKTPECLWIAASCATSRRPRAWHGYITMQLPLSVFSMWFNQSENKISNLLSAAWSEVTLWHWQEIQTLICAKQE